MRDYELMTIVKPSLGDDKAKTISQEIVALIEASKGDILKTDFWGKRKFAFEINGDKEGYYNVMWFTLDPAELAKISAKIKLMDSLVRYLISTVKSSNLDQAPKARKDSV